MKYIRKTVIIFHPHFTIPGGAGKVVLEIGKRLSQKVNILCITQQITDSYIENYKEILFHSINGPTTDSFSFWLLFPLWQYRNWKMFDKLKTVDTTILCSVFPSNWIIFPYKLFHPEIKIIWLCQEPSAFVQDNKWINAINNPVKRLIAKLFNPLFKLVDNNLAKIPNFLIANSYYSKKLIKMTYKRESVVIYPGIDKKRFYPILFSKKKDYILTVSRLSKYKNIDILLKAFAAIKNKNVKLFIVGDGEERKSLEILAESLKIENRVSFLGKVDDASLPSLFQKAKLFVLCSKNEPFGIVPVEAMACGTPVIAEESGGLTETVISGKTGLLIKNIDSKKLCLAIDNIEESLKELSANCSVHLSGKFDWEVNKLLSLL